MCALSMETKGKKIESAGGFTLREPYAWESDPDVAGFVLPRWMWDAVGGETVSWTVGIAHEGYAANALSVVGPACKIPWYCPST